MSDQTFRDWIPEGEDTGAFTDQGFSDFVPEPKPVHHPEVETPIETPKKKEK